MRIYEYRTNIEICSDGQCNDVPVIVSYRWTDGLPELISKNEPATPDEVEIVSIISLLSDEREMGLYWLLEFVEYDFDGLIERIKEDRLR